MFEQTSKQNKNNEICKRVIISHAHLSLKLHKFDLIQK